MKKKTERRETEAQQLDRKYGKGTAAALDELAQMGQDMMAKVAKECKHPKNRVQPIEGCGYICGACGVTLNGKQI